VQQVREQLQQKTCGYQEKMKAQFDKRAKEIIFSDGDLVLKLDAARDDKGNHGKFDNLWIGPFQIREVQDNNTFILNEVGGEDLGSPVNGRFLKHFIQG